MMKTKGLHQVSSTQAVLLNINNGNDQTWLFGGTTGTIPTARYARKALFEAKTSYDSSATTYSTRNAGTIALHDGIKTEPLIALTAADQASRSPYFHTSVVVHLATYKSNSQG